MAKATPKFGEIGATGLPVYGGLVYDEPVAKLTGEEWRRTVRNMTANDPVVRAILITIEMMTRQVKWEVTPFSEEKEDVENALFVQQCMFDDMSQTWQHTLAEILSMIPWGWSWFEMCFKSRSGFKDNPDESSNFTDGKVGWSKWAVRAQESHHEWIFDPNGNVTAMVQCPAPDYTFRTIPSIKSLHFRTSSHKNNPEGHSICRAIYRPWFFKSNIENIEGIGVERDLAGIVVIRAPVAIFKSDATEEEKELKAYLEGIAAETYRNENEGLVFPTQKDENGNDLYDITLLTSGGKRQFDTSGIIDRYDQRILMSVMADFLLLGSKAVGSYALSTDKVELFCAAITSWLDSICETINRHAIPLLLFLNGKPQDRAPKLNHGQVEKLSLEELGNFISQLNSAGIFFDEEEQSYLKQQGNIPVTKQKQSSKTEQKSDQNAGKKTEQKQKEKSQ